MNHATLAAAIMERPDVYQHAGRSLETWGDYLYDRLEEAGLPASREDVTALNLELTKVWRPESPRWNLDEVMKSTAAADIKALRAAQKLEAHARSLDGGELRYRQDGHEWRITGLKAGARSGTPQARVAPTGRWFCFTSAEGFYVGGRRAK